jgi:hypothetical protein
VQSPAQLNKVSDGFPIYAEAGGEPIAELLMTALPNLVKHVESRYGGNLKSLPTIIVCISQSCYQKFATFQDSFGETLNDKRITINGALLKSKNVDPIQILGHELSHYYWFSNGVIFQPRWFEEGLADWTSGGAERKVSSLAAQQAIQSGKTIQVNLASGLLNYVLKPIQAPDGNWSMFYKQSELFVQYLYDTDSTAFNQLILELHKTKNLETAWLAVYSDSFDKKWAMFVDAVRVGNI